MLVCPHLCFSWTYLVIPLWIVKMGLHQDFSFILGISNFMPLSLHDGQNHIQLKSLVNPREMQICTLICLKIRFHRNFSTFLRFHKNVHYPYRNHYIWSKTSFRWISLVNLRRTSSLPKMYVPKPTLKKTEMMSFFRDVFLFQFWNLATCSEIFF